MTVIVDGQVVSADPGEVGEPVATSVYRVVFDAFTDPDPGETTAEFALRLVDQDNLPVPNQELALSLWDDAENLLLSPNATFGGSSEGTILVVGSYPTIKARTDSLGRFAASIDDSTKETIYLTCSGTDGGPPITAPDALEITFS